MNAESLTDFGRDPSVEVGDCVVASGTNQVMCVEVVHEQDNGKIVSCSYFDSKGDLHFQSLNCAALRAFPRTILDRKVSRGDTVKLKSGGPSMSILELWHEDQGVVAVCEWTGPSSQLRRRGFAEPTLVPADVVDHLTSIC